MFRGVWERRVTVRGADHKCTLISRHWLAKSFYKQGRVEEAEDELFELAKVMKKSLGAKSKETLRSLYWWGKCQVSRGRYEMALAHFTELEKDYALVMGAGHQDTVGVKSGWHGYWV